jgi:hypothetical protein
MPSDRLLQLHKFYDEEPGDPFNLYALALEYLKHDTARSRQYFETLLTVHENYLPAYYHAAKLYLGLGEKEKAAMVFLNGMSLARKIKDPKTLRELQSAYDEMMFE